MRVIHTADWHLGNSMHDIDRSEESRQFLAWLKGQIVEFGAECLVVAGDIFDTTNPPTEARRMYFQFLRDVLGTRCRNIVIVGGNHDSGAMLDAPRDILEFLNIQVVGSLGERPVEAVYETAENLRAGRDIPILATGHLYASKLEGRPENDEGKDAKEHGMRDIVGNLGTIPVSVFPEGFDYVALGHIHYTTMVAQNPKVRYSGSPFVLGFDEANIPHHILAIDLQKGAAPAVQKIETPQYFKFLRVSGKVEDIVLKLNELKGLHTDKPLKVEVEFEYVPGVSINDALASVVEGAPFEVVSKKAKRASSLSADSFSDDTLESVDVLEDEEIFKRLLLSKAGVTEMNEDIKKYYDDYLPLFMQVVEEVKKEESEEA